MNILSFYLNLYKKNVPNNINDVLAFGFKGEIVTEDEYKNNRSDWSGYILKKSPFGPHYYAMEENGFSLHEFCELLSNGTKCLVVIGYFEGENEKFALTYVHGDQKIEILTSRKKLIQALAVYSPSNKLYLVNIDSELAENINGLSGKVFIDKDTKYEVFSRMEYFEQMGALLIRELKKYVFVVLPIFLLFSVALDFERENLSSKSIIEHNINEEKYNILCTENRKISKKNDKLKLSLSDGKDFYECD